MHYSRFTVTRVTHIYSYFLVIQDDKGHLIQSELYHFTDKTGNDGDNTWFMVEPKFSLVSAIWTKNTYIKLNWDIRARRVTFQVYIRGTVAVDTIVTVLDLDQLEELDPKSNKFNFTRIVLEPSEHCVTIPFDVHQCGKHAKDLIVTAEVMARIGFILPARYLTKTEKYEFLLPEDRFEDNTNEAVQGQCFGASKVNITNQELLIGVFVDCFITVLPPPKRY